MLTLKSGQTVFALASWAAERDSLGIHWVGYSFEDFAGELLARQAKGLPLFRWSRW